MEIMRLLWEKRYASFGLTAQRLRDRAVQAIKDRERNRQRDMDVLKILMMSVVMLRNGQKTNFAMEIRN